MLPPLTSRGLLPPGIHLRDAGAVSLWLVRDSGSFHGACFTRDGRSVIVLKQMVDSSARWLNDLLHEVDHLRDPDRGELRTWIELGDISEWSEAPEERHANDFVADVLFSGRAEPVLTRCLQAAQDSVQRLKAVVPQIAKQADVPVDVLANHLAFRLSARGVNWWATAATFQEHTTPWRHAADLLLSRLDLASLDAIDRATFAALQRECIRHYFWHVPFGQKALNYARRLGRIALEERIGARIRSRIGKAQHPAEGRQTPIARDRADALDFALHDRVGACVHSCASG